MRNGKLKPEGMDEVWMDTGQGKKRLKSHSYSGYRRQEEP
jgi:hypothetical protein